MQIANSINISSLVTTEDLFQLTEIFKTTPVAKLEENSFTVFKVVYADGFGQVWFMSDLTKKEAQTLTENVFLVEAARTNGLSLRHVPAELKTMELCTQAVLSNGLALQYVPNHMKTVALCALAVSKNGLALEFVPGVCCSQEVCLAAVITTRKALKFVPVKVKEDIPFLKDMVSVIDLDDRTILVRDL